MVLVDAAVSFDDLGFHLVDADFPMHRKHLALPTDAATREQYVGRYQFGPAKFLEVYVEGERLLTRMTGPGQGVIEIAREGPDRFFTRGVDATLDFARGADGKVDAVTIHQNGFDVRGPRTP